MLGKFSASLGRRTPESEMARATPLKDDGGHRPADRTASASWCLKCGRAIVHEYKRGWVLQYPGAICVEPAVQTLASRREDGGQT